MKPKIAIIHYSAPPLIGGVESIIEAHSQLFAANGYPVKIIAGQGEVFDSQVELKIIRQMSSLSGWKRGKWKESLDPFRDLSLTGLEKIIFKKLAREIRDRDFIIIHNCLTMPFNMALTTALDKLIKKERRKKFISWCHDSVFLDPSYKEFLAGVEENGFPYLLLKTALKKVHYVAISRSRAQGLAKLFNINLRKIRVIPDGIDPEKFLNLSPQVIPIFKKFNLFQSDLIFLIPARVTRRKNIELALKITKEVNRKGLKAKTIITGPPDLHKKGGTSYLKFLKRLSKDLGIEDRIVFLSQIKVDFDLLRDLYKLSDILLLPSYQEGFGLPLLEAGLSRLPVFCSSIGPLKEVGGKEVHYFSLKENPKKIAQEILKFYKENKSLRMFKKVLRNYTWESIFKKKIEPYLHKL